MPVILVPPTQQAPPTGRNGTASLIIQDSARPIARGSSTKGTADNKDQALNITGNEIKWKGKFDDTMTVFSIRSSYEIISLNRTNMERIPI